MATNLSKFVGSFNADTTLSTPFIQSITTPGFQPKVVIFMLGNAADSGTDADQGIGFSDGTNHRAVTWTSAHGQATSVCKTSTSAAACIIQQNGSGTAGPTGTIAMTATGFDVTWSAKPSFPFRVMFIALAGSDIGNIAIGTNTMPTTAIAKATTGLGFTPNFVMLISGSRTASTSVGASANLSYGCAISATKRFAHALAVLDGSSMTLNADSLHNSNACLQGLTTAAALNYRADFTSFDSGTGFTITFSAAPASAFQFYYLAIGGANLNWDIGTLAKPATATAQTVSGGAFLPEIALWSNSDLTTLNTITATSALAVGSSDGTNVKSMYATEANSINTVAGTKLASKACQDGAPANSTTTVATFTSFNSDGWTITWDATGAANQISWIALAGTTVVSSETVGEMVASTQYGQSQPVINPFQIIDY